MRNINNIKVNEEIEWVGGQKLDHQMSGFVVERVRSRSRPSYSGTITAGKPTKPDVSFIARSCGKLYWVSADQIKAASKKKNPAKLVAKPRKEPKVITKAAQPAKRIPIVKNKKPESKIEASPEKAKSAIKTTKSATQKGAIRIMTPCVFSGLDSPIIPRPGLPGLPMPLPFKRDFSCLSKHLSSK